MAARRAAGARPGAVVLPAAQQQARAETPAAAAPVGSPARGSAAVAARVGPAASLGRGLSGLLVPAQGALLGAFVGTGTIAQLETTLGRKLAISHNFFGWTDDCTAGSRTPSRSGASRSSPGRHGRTAVGIPLDDIISGAHDAMIRTRAQAAKRVGQKFFLRWGHEMNGNWYPWDGFHNGANPAATAKYIAAYRHIHDLFVAAGATNVLWVFSPNVDSVPGDAWNQWSNYYPGDSLRRLDGVRRLQLGHRATGSSWRTFRTSRDASTPGSRRRGSRS